MKTSGGYAWYRPALVLLWLAVSGALWAPSVLADGGHVALHTTSGAYSVTLFTAPVPLASGSCDLSLLVQDAGTGAVVSGAAASLTLTRSGEPPQVVAFAHSAAGNPLLLSGQANLGAGDYALRLRVRRPSAHEVEIAGTLAVAANHGRRSTLLFGLGLPVAAVLLFLVNQHAKMKVALRTEV